MTEAEISVSFRPFQNWNLCKTPGKIFGAPKLMTCELIPNIILLVPKSQQIRDLKIRSEISRNILFLMIKIKPDFLGFESYRAQKYQKFVVLIFLVYYFQANNRAALTFDFWTVDQGTQIFLHEC